MMAMLLAYALLLQSVSTGTPPPEPCSVVDERHALGGVVMVVFDCDDERVLAIRGSQAWDLRDFIAIPLRRLFGYPDTHADYARSMMRPGEVFTIIGHSSGGALASALGAELGVGTVTFNAGRPPAAHANDGAQQINVVIRGDVLGGFAPPLPGTTIYLDPVPGLRLHPMSSVVAALEALQ